MKRIAKKLTLSATTIRPLAAAHLDGIIGGSYVFLPTLQPPFVPSGNGFCVTFTCSMRQTADCTLASTAVTAQQNGCR
jgi:hypothetical protein